MNRRSSTLTTRALLASMTSAPLLLVGGAGVVCALVADIVLVRALRGSADKGARNAAKLAVLFDGVATLLLGRWWLQRLGYLSVGYDEGANWYVLPLIMHGLGFAAFLWTLERITRSTGTPLDDAMLLGNWYREGSLPLFVAVSAVAGFFAPEFLMGFALLRAIGLLPTFGVLRAVQRQRRTQLD